MSVSAGPPESEAPPPIGVFWDIENCAVPSGRSAATVVQRLRERFFQGHREAEFICVCDINKENKAVIQELNNCQVRVRSRVASVSSGERVYSWLDLFPLR